MNYLFIGAHVDDSELSCAGLIQTLLSSGEHVNVISMSHIYSNGMCNIDLSNEFVESMAVLGVTDRYCYNVETRRFNANQNDISDIIYEKTRGYDRVITHDISDRHPDHRTVAEQIRRIYNGSTITFITPWNGNENPNHFIEISSEQLEKKIEAIGCYVSQNHRAYTDPDFIRSWARYNGIKCGKRYAEAFRIERLIQ